MVRVLIRPAAVDDGLHVAAPPLQPPVWKVTEVVVLQDEIVALVDNLVASAALDYAHASSVPQTGSIFVEADAFAVPVQAPPLVSPEKKS